MKVVLSIAGMDPSAGAGVLADIKAISAMGCFGIAAVTSLTIQNTRGVFGIYDQDGEVVRRQLSALFDDFDVSAIKTGMLPSSDVIDVVAEMLKQHRRVPLVLDPVVRSTSGYDLVDTDALEALIETLFPLAALVTPNVAEAERITGQRVAGPDDVGAARAILDLGPKAVLITGGDQQGDLATDTLVDDRGVATFSTPRIVSLSTHGSGCTLSSAIACLLARGLDLRDSIERAKKYVGEAIRSAPGIGQGHGPMNHFPDLAKLE